MSDDYEVKIRNATPEELAAVERQGGMSVRLVGGFWHNNHFDIEMQARPIADGVALMLVFENGAVPIDGDLIDRTGEKLGREIAEILKRNAAVAIASAAAIVADTITDTQEASGAGRRRAN